MTTKLPMESLVPGGKPIDLVSYYDEFEWYYRNCEPETKHWFVRNVQPDWEIFDIGANVGVYSVLFSRLASRGHVVAFEPTVTADMLRTNLEHNGCSNVQVEQIALGSKTGAVEDGIYRIWGEEPERQVYPFYRLDDYVRNNNIIKLDCIKIDVDSFDFEVLLGAKETIRTLKPVIVVELNHALSRRNQSNIKALEWLYEQGIQEVLSLDGDNFVITPGREPSFSYPVQGSIRVVFADNRELPSAEDEGAIKVLKSIDPHHAAVVHGDAQTTVLPNGSQIEVVTGEPQWAYSVAFPMPSQLEEDPQLRVLMDLEVLSGRIGVGCLSREGQYIGPERQIGPGGRRALLLPLSDPSNLDQLMVRNVSSEGRSRARIYGVKVGRLVEEEASEKEISATALAQRVHEAISSEGANADFVPPDHQRSIRVVGYDDLSAALNFAEPFRQPEGAGEQPLAYWKMERDDAPIFRYVYRNLRPRRHLEFGTWEGFGVVACAESCDAEIWTLNLPDGERTSEGHSLYVGTDAENTIQTDAGEFIGRLYREAGYAPRVHQILCNSMTWVPEGMGAGFFDSVLIDGGHTYDVVTSDTDKAINLVRSGGIVMWHDFCPEEEALQAHVAPRGVVEAIARNLGRWAEHFHALMWVKPSWVLIGVRR